MGENEENGYWNEERWQRDVIRTEKGMISPMHGTPASDLGMRAFVVLATCSRDGLETRP